ncbi:MAG: hypothetical protein IJ805_05375, partial [Lachnospiraceae bacterium]|nr:hypothetical protein [Lachnospiraceae bacterium]
IRFYKYSAKQFTVGNIDMGLRDIWITFDDLLILVTEAEQQGVVEKFVRAKIPVTGTVLRTLVIDEFPVNDRGKILYGKLGEEYL